MPSRLPRPLLLVLVGLMGIAFLASPAAGQGESPAQITASFDGNCTGFTAESDKDISHVVIRFADGTSDKVEPIDQPTYGVDGSTLIASITVKSGTTSTSFTCTTSGGGDTGGGDTGGGDTGGGDTGGDDTDGGDTGGGGTGGGGTGDGDTGGTGGGGGTGDGETGDGGTGTGGTGGTDGIDGEDPDAGLAQEVAIDRIGGPARIETAILIAQGLFDDDAAGAVVLARQDIPADAIAATPFSVAVEAPVLLSTPDILLGMVADEIDRVLQPGGTVHLAGGVAALSAGIEAQLQQMGYATDRIGGANRFSTATQIADRLFGLSGFEATYDQPGASVLLADGGGFTSALVAGPAATSVAGAVLLTSGADMAPETTAWLADNGSFAAVAIGTEAQTAAPEADAIGGSDPHVTATDVAEAYFADPSIAGVATSAAFPDGLTGGVDIAHRGGPLLLSAASELPPSLENWVAANTGTLTELRIYGGTAALSEGVAEALQAATAAS